MLHEEFPRTTCACAACVECCRWQPGPLAPGELARIAEFLGETVEAARVHFWASPGAVVMNQLTGVARTIGTITPRMEGGRCVFLGTDDRCRIHPVAPFGCAAFDTHQHRDEWHHRSVALHVAIDTDDGYRQDRAALPPARSWHPKG